MGTPKTRVPKIAPHEYAMLNDSYYSATPHEYFLHRLGSLALLIADDNLATDSLREGIDLLDTQLIMDINWDDKGKSKYASSEIVVLLHHACETLLRLYISHANRNPCPWVAMSSLMDFGEFKRKVAALRGHFSDPEILADILEVFTLTNDKKSQPNISDEVWTTHEKGLVMILEFAAGEFLDNSSIYNAAKHGLAVIPHEIGMSIGFPSIIMQKEGPAVSYLQRVRDKDNQKWLKTTQWISPRSLMMWVVLIVQQIENLWVSAKINRKIIELDDKTRINFANHETIKTLLESDLEPDENGVSINISTMSEELHLSR